MSHTKLPSGWRAARFRLADRVYGPGTKIAPWTFVGDERIAIGSIPTPESLPELADREGITHVVNCRARAQTVFSGDKDMERAVFGPDHVAHAPMWDHGRPQSPEAWAEAAEFAAEALDDPTAKVLIHCQRGRRRSVLVAYATLRLRGHTAQDAARLILSHRKEAHLVPAYRKSVEDWLAERKVASSLRASLVGKELSFDLSEPWELTTRSGDSGGRASVIEEKFGVRGGDGDALLLELLTPLTYQGASYHAVVAKPRRGESLVDSLLGGRPSAASLYGVPAGRPVEESLTGDWWRGGLAMNVVLNVSSDSRQA